MLNINQSPAELNRIYGELAYYWYLKSDAFREAFLKPLAQIVNELGGSCLDVGCGEGWLADYITIPYFGFDGSEAAIAVARDHQRYHPARDRQKKHEAEFYVGRFEAPRFDHWQFDTIIFGGIFSVLVKPESYVELLDLYRQKFSPKHFIIYDLERLATDSIDAAFRRVKEIHATAALDGIEEVKKHRKILVYEC